MSGTVDRADPRAEDRVGSVLNDKWTLERLIGKGGMAAVYAARHRNGARAAVKMLHPDLARMPEVRDRFLQEGYAANRVEHRGAVQVLDDDTVQDGPDAGAAYIVMEQLEGESLEARAQREPALTEAEILAILDAVLEVLVAAHAHGVVHRDLKPENLFLARDPERDGIRVKVLDFGLARLSESANVTSAGLALGTPSYMSPEQASGKRDEIDGRTDIFAMGATAFRLRTGRRVHEADNAIMQVVLVATQPARSILDVKPDTSPAFAAIVDRALAFAKEDRYPDAAAMRADVLRALADLPPADGVRAPMPSLNVVPYSLRQPNALGGIVIAAGSSEVASRAAFEPTLGSTPSAAAVASAHTIAGDAVSAQDRPTSFGTPVAKRSAQRGEPTKRGLGLPLALLFVAGVGAAFWSVPELRDRLDASSMQLRELIDGGLRALTDEDAAGTSPSGALDNDRVGAEATAPAIVDPVAGDGDAGDEDDEETDDEDGGVDEEDDDGGAVAAAPAHDGGPRAAATGNKTSVTPAKHAPGKPPPKKRGKDRWRRKRHR